MTVKGISKRFKQMADLYKQFGSSWTGLDWSDEALISMFNNESHGTPIDCQRNGFYIGKKNGWELQFPCGGKTL